VLLEGMAGVAAPALHVNGTAEDDGAVGLESLHVFGPFETDAEGPSRRRVAAIAAARWSRVHSPQIARWVFRVESSALRWGLNQRKEPPMLSWLAGKLIAHNMRRLREGDPSATVRMYADDVRFAFPGKNSPAPATNGS